MCMMVVARMMICVLPIYRYMLYSTVCLLGVQSNMHLRHGRDHVNLPRAQQLGPFAQVQSRIGPDGINLHSDNTHTTVSTAA
jgi:hypothetical protein